MSIFIIRNGLYGLFCSIVTFHRLKASVQCKLKSFTQHDTNTFLVEAKAPTTSRPKWFYDLLGTKVCNNPTYKSAPQCKKTTKRTTKTTTSTTTTKPAPKTHPTTVLKVCDYCLTNSVFSFHVNFSFFRRPAMMKKSTCDAPPSKVS